MRMACEDALRQLYRRKCLHDLRPRIRSRSKQNRVNGKDLRQTPPDAAARIKCLLRVLHNELHAPAKGKPLGTLERPNVASVPAHRAAVGAQESEQDAHERTLTRAAPPL